MKTRGFTLIELLVVISIIGLLASIVLTSLKSARAKGRDATRLATLEQLRNGIELYNSSNGSYPVTNVLGSWFATCEAWGAHTLSGSSGYIPSLAPTYRPILPVDPKPLAGCGDYAYNGTGRDYMAMTYWTVETYTITNNPAPRPAASTTELDFAIYSTGGSQF